MTWTASETRQPSVRNMSVSVGQHVGLILAAALFTGTGWAQTAPAPASGTADQDTNGLQEVIVTAQFRNENLQQTPLAITAITGDKRAKAVPASARETATARLRMAGLRRFMAFPPDEEFLVCDLH